MRDKRKSKATIMDAVKSNPAPRPRKGVLETQTNLHEASIAPTEVTAEMLESVKRYNQNLDVTATDELYGSVTPISQVLVKCYLVEPEISESGLITPFTQRVEVPTQSGQGKYEDIELPYLLSPRVKVIAIPANTSAVKPGDIVQLNDRVIQATVVGNGNNRKPMLHNSFVRVDKTSEYPKDIEDAHFGYLLVSVSDIKVILQGA